MNLHVKDQSFSHTAWHSKLFWLHYTLQLCLVIWSVAVVVACTQQHRSVRGSHILRSIMWEEKQEWCGRSKTKLFVCWFLQQQNKEEKEYEKKNWLGCVGTKDKDQEASYLGLSVAKTNGKSIFKSCSVNFALKVSPLRYPTLYYTCNLSNQLGSARI